MLGLSYGEWVARFACVPVKCAPQGVLKTPSHVLTTKLLSMLDVCPL